MRFPKHSQLLLCLSILTVAACDSGGGSDGNSGLSDNDLSVTRIDVRATSDVDNRLVDVEVVDLEVATITVEGG
ncbi:MAG: hypothetical protein AAAFM81_03470 [Pseudomonadota bacterium]